MLYQNWLLTRLWLTKAGARRLNAEAGSGTVGMVSIEGMIRGASVRSKPITEFAHSSSAKGA